MREMVGVAAMAAAFAVVLSGCSLWQDGEKIVGQVREGIAARQVLQELADELRARDDVEHAPLVDLDQPTPRPIEVHNHIHRH